MSHYLTDSERAELAARPIPQYHFEGREQSYVDELKAMPWKKLVAYCDSIRAADREAPVVDLTGPKPVVSQNELISTQALQEGRVEEWLDVWHWGGFAAITDDGELVIDLTRGDAA